MLTRLADVLGADRRAVVCRELTKTYEEILRGGLRELADWAAGGVRGEVTIVARRRGACRRPRRRRGAVHQRVAEGVRLREAVADVAAATGVRKNALYDAVVAQQTRPRVR